MLNVLTDKTSVDIHPLTMIKILKDNIEIHYCKQSTLNKVLAHISNKLVDMYEPMYERLMIKEHLLISQRKQ